MPMTLEIINCQFLISRNFKTRRAYANGSWKLPLTSSVRNDKPYKVPFNGNSIVNNAIKNTDNNNV